MAERKTVAQNNTLVGSSIRGFSFEALIAQGGFGQVYRAFQASVDRQVAIKVILPQYANQPNFVRRFELEAQMVAQLEHPFIVPLFDYWRDPSGAYLVMRMLRGGSLASLLENYEGPIPTPLAARLLEQVALALTAAHRNGVIHRDLKPANILLDDEQNAYLADFGIAKRLFTEEPYEFDRFGSPAYVAPEIVTGDVISAQTDIYSLGIILYEMLTATLPYNAPSQTLVLQKHLTGDIPSVTGLRPDLPAVVDDVIRRATQRQPVDRYADATMMARDFRKRVLREATDQSEDMRATKPVPVTRPASPNSSQRQQTPILNIAAVAQKNPYKGLRAFQEADQSDFHGREGVVQRLTQRLRGNGMQSRCIALIGASGSGKSSLVRAGLLPALRRAAVPGSNKWFFAIMTPGTSPLVELEQTLERIAVKSSAGVADAILAKPAAILDIIERLIPPQGEFLLVVDQFEEVFSLVSNDVERTAFLEALSAFITHPRARLILTLRADFVDAALSHPNFGAVVRDCTEFILPLTASEMEAAIVKPAERLRVQYEPGLIPRIIQDIGMQPGTLPLLQYVLYELFENRTGDVLTTLQYDNEGGVQGALARRAETLYAGLDAEAQRATERLFLRLIAVGNDSEDTRRRLPQQETMQLGATRETMQSVLEVFGRHRLLTFDRDSVTRAPTVEIAHEALIKHWGRLRGWIDGNRSLLRQRQQLAAAAAEWISNGREGSFLARGGRLNTFEALPNTEHVLLTASETEYLDASLRLRKAESSRTRRTIMALIGIATIALVAALFALFQRNDAQRERDRADVTARSARADQLAIQATLNQSDLDLALLLNIEALNNAETYEARRSLLDNLQYSPRLERFLHGADSAVRAIAVTEDGSLAAAGTANGNILLWTLDTPNAPPAVLRGHEGVVNSVAFSMDGSLLVSGGGDNTVRIWDVATQAQLGDPLRGHEDEVWDVAFSPDATLIASGSEDATIRIWDVASRQQRGDALTDQSDPVYAVAFSPDGTTFASGSEDGTVRIWETATGEAAAEPLVGHSNWVLDVEYSPDGTLIASSDASGIVMLWSVADGYTMASEPLRVSPGSYAWDIAFHPDGQQLATASADDNVRLVPLSGDDTATAETLVGHTNDVWELAYRPDGTLISGGRDERVIVWDTDERPALGQVIHNDLPLTGIAINHDGTLATGMIDEETGAIVAFWDLASQSISRLLRTSTNQSTALGFVPNSDTLLTTDSSRRLLAWSAEATTPRIIAQVEFTIYALAISPDAQYAAIAGDRSIVHVYSLSDNSLVVELPLDVNAIYTLAFAPDSTTLVAGDEAGRLSRWATSDWSPLGESVQLASTGISALAFSRDGSQIAIGTRDLLDATVQVFSAADLTPITGALAGHENWIVSLNYLDDNTLASASHDSTVRLWRIPSGEALTLRGHLAEATGVARTPDGQLISVGDDGRVVVWQLALQDWRARACAVANRTLTPDEWQRYLGDVAYTPSCTDS
jgi:WD40 repeat protein/serine/threonine protein kinase